MANIRLTGQMRLNIAARICDDAFAERRKAVAAEKPDLFRAALEHLHGKETLRRVARLPKPWFTANYMVHLNIGGWSYRLSIPVDKAIRTPAFYPNETDGRHEQQVIKDETLAQRIKEHAQREEALREECRVLNNALRSLLNSCNTVAAFLTAMPEVEPIIGKIVAVPAPGKSLVPAGRQVAAMIETARSGQTIEVSKAKKVAAK